MKREPGLTATSSGIKRKAEEQLPRAPRPTNSPSTSGAPNRQVLSKPAPPPAAPKKTAANITKRDPSKPVARNGALATSGPPKPAVAAKPVAPKKEGPPAKAPPKGSFADIMAQAKAKQETNPNPVGGLKNKHVEREKVSWVEHKRRQTEAKREAKARSAGRPYKPLPGSKPPKPARKTASPVEPSYKGTAKPTPKAPEMPAYRGTAGLASNRKHNDRGKRRMNEYLGTDEEDEGDYGGYDDYYSDASSDMEAGFDDQETEEAAALRFARQEDEKEQRMEEAAKQAKLERQKKLAALASRKR